MPRIGSKRGQGELAILETIRNRAKSGSRGVVRLGIGDDCSIVKVRSGEELTVTTDLSIAGRHFRLDWHPPEAVGHRTLARGLSDLAAMGARPVAAFLSLGLPRELTQAEGRRRPWVERFFDGLFALADLHNAPLAGGDLAESPVALADIVLVGAVPRGKALLRSGARPGDLLYVTGRLGGAAAGLARLAGLSRLKSFHPGRIADKFMPSLAPHFYPQPRIAQGQWLRRSGVVTAALDISDGLSTDLAHLCEESGVGAEVNASLLPRHDGASLDQALHGGEDYELLFSARPTARLPRVLAGVSVTKIGQIVNLRRSHPAVTLIADEGRQNLVPRGWEHFG